MATDDKPGPPEFARPGFAEAIGLLEGIVALLARQQERVVPPRSFTRCFEAAREERRLGPADPPHVAKGSGLNQTEARRIEEGVPL
jgi:hypothetical protein